MVIPWEEAAGAALGAIFGGGSSSGDPSPVGYSFSGSTQQDNMTPLLIAGGIGVAVIVIVMMVK